MNDQPPPMARPRVAAGALFTDDQGRVLLVKPTYKDGWDIPGGYVEPGESPKQACEREIKEELGIERTVGRLLVVDWAPSEQDGDKLLFVFDGGLVSEEARESFTLQSDEISTVVMHDPEMFDELMPARLAKRILGAATALRDQRFEFLERGEFPT